MCVDVEAVPVREIRLRQLRGIETMTTDEARTFIRAAAQEPFRLSPQGEAEWLVLLDRLETSETLWAAACKERDEYRACWLGERDPAGRVQSLEQKVADTEAVQRLLKAANVASLVMLYSFLIGVPDDDIEAGIRRTIEQVERALIAAGEQTEVDRIREGHRVCMVRMGAAITGQ